MSDVAIGAGQHSASVRPLTVKRSRPLESLGELLLLVAAMVGIIGVVLIFVFVGKEALPAFFSNEARVEICSQFKGVPQSQLDHPSIWLTLKALFFTKMWQPVSEYPKYSLLPLILGTIKVTLIAVALATPIAIGAAVYTAEFASKRVREVIKPFIEILAGFPSVVLGFLALIVFATYIQKITGSQYRLNAFVGGAAVAIAVIPIIYTVTEDALSAIPRSFREASLALGATKAQTSISIVVPAAASGITAAVILGIGRAIGETMIVLMATGNAALLTLSPFDGTRTMAATIGQEMGEVPFGSPHYNILFLIGVLLFVMTFTLNTISQIFVKRIARKLGTNR